MAELVDELADSKKVDMVSGRHANSTTKFFARGSASCSTCKQTTQKNEQGNEGVGRGGGDEATAGGGQEG